MKKITTILAVMLMIITASEGQWVDIGENTYPLNANHEIFSVITDVSGNVYAAGAFTDSTAFNYVGKWTGDSAWAPLGTGSHALKANGYIYCLAKDAAGNIYAAGGFSDQQYQSEGHIYVAKWSDTSWTEVGSGVYTTNTTTPYAIQAMVLDNSGNIYVGGNFPDGSGKYYVSKWNGSSWSELGTGNNALNANGFIKTMAIDPSGNLYVGGEFRDSAGYTYVAEWNGTNWSEMGTSNNALNAISPIHAITTDLSGNVYVAFDDTTSNFYVAKWSGSNWTQVGRGNAALNANNSIDALTTDLSGNLYAAGNFTDVNGLQYVAKWNDTTWAELGTGSNALDPNYYILTITTDTASNVYAAGLFTNVYNKFFIAEFNPNNQGPNGINIARATLNEINIVPNPAKGQANIILSAVNTEAGVNVVIYDITGRVITTLYDGELQAGEKTITLDTEGMASGIYLVTMINGTSTAIQKRFVKL